MRRALAVAGALVLAGCGARAPTREDATAIWIDPSTGCRYIVYADGIGDNRVGSLSIRFRADGTPDCPGSTPRGG